MRTARSASPPGDSELSGSALAVAAKRGRLVAVRWTEKWYSTRKWVQESKERR